jgi:P-type Cu+ transporter
LWRWQFCQSEFVSYHRQINTHLKCLQNGILVQNAEAIERAEKVNCLLTDKTGTLTAGKPQVTQVIPDAEVGTDTLLQIAASLEQSSEHPLARAIVDAAKAKNLPALPVEDFGSTTGGDVAGTVSGRKVLLAKKSLSRKLE